MTQPDGSNSTKSRLRLVAGVLGVATMILVLLRTYAMINEDLLTQDFSIVHLLRLAFPFSLALFFGYIAWKGELPFTKKNSE